MKKQNLTQKLLDWYELNGRDLPWRVKGKAHPNPYVIFVSEVMLQQTTVKTVIPYFERFMRRFPDVFTLASTTEDEVYQYWQGLGYYSRARSLLKAARTVVESYGGVFPHHEKDVAKLKGFGTYTIASFLALAYNQPTTVVDGNVMRIMCRLHYLTAPLETIKDEIFQKAAALSSKKYPADYASAIMDLGATICTPKHPQCLLCPWQEACLSVGKDNIEQIPYRNKPDKKEMFGNVYIIRNKKSEIFIRKRTEKGLLSGLYEFPWGEKPLLSGATDTGKEVTHIFTHIKLKLKIFTLSLDDPKIDGTFVTPADLDKYALSTLMKKVWQKINPVH
ncbi:MAG: A/G-specific adenine glycosylase [Alphaproteobacteria bacterium]|nr:A/G-specific adenine glycosylase [Alphaproteobacteria bacterium]